MINIQRWLIFKEDKIIKENKYQRWLIYKKISKEYKIELKKNNQRWLIINK
jgi:hypothetical protein